MTTQTFEEAIAEYIARCKEQLGKERMEGLPPAPPSPYDQKGPPWESPLRLTEKFTREYAWSIGDDNPLYTDPEYGKKTRYGTQIAPGPVMVVVRAGGGQGPQRPQGYPVADFVAGTAWEFFDVIHANSGPFRSSKTDMEVLEKPGSRGNLIFLICELFFHDGHGDIPAKGYGTLILVPIESMGATRAMSVDKLGEKMMYTRGASGYSKEDVAKHLAAIEGNRRRGSDTLYWEDVEIGDRVGPLVLPPWSLQDQVANNFSRSFGEGGSFETAYHLLRERPGGARTNPATMWPWTPNAEHEDALLAAYRAQSLPFDHGVQRFQIPNQLLANWMGDDGFIRRFQVALRRPAYYSDVTMYQGEVVKKFKETQHGEAKLGGAPGEAEYHAVGIRIEGTNQVGQSQVQGSATVYLSSRTAGPIKLPVPHLARSPYVPYEKFYRDWYG